ncbi:hypothetical protein DUI87_22882 [Hirundo rustica rustica]|uniref:Uncharacterized protein n=1 Tax=Hirundo rustica rustica TaxID=333673 RepID=A0A3M0JHW1_HIRRU|nr:hypothetical protein DUI87_22882 [Hirundo rustica rustica]
MVSNLQLHLNTRKYMKPNGIHPKVLRELGEELTNPLSIIYRESWLTREITIEWKSENVMPIYGRCWKEDPGNYEPVSLTLVPGKAMEQIIPSATTWHTQDSWRIRPSQCTFVKDSPQCDSIGDATLSTNYRKPPKSMKKKEEEGRRRKKKEEEGRRRKKKVKKKEKKKDSENTKILHLNS